MSDYQQPSHSQAAPTHTLAIVSLIASILGLTLFPAIGSIIGLITGYIARRDIREQPGRYAGDGLAIAGIVTGWIGIALQVIGICIALAFFVLFFGGFISLAFLEGLQ